MQLRESVIEAMDNISEDQLQRLLDWLQSLKREREPNLLPES